MKKEKILVIGCGEHARMVIDNIEDQNQFSVFGLTTHLNEELGKDVYGYPVVGKDKDIEGLIKKHKDIKGYILGVGNMKARARLASWLDTFVKAVNVIHPQALISRHARIGVGNLLEAYTKVANGATLGNHCIINSYTAVNHDQNIGHNVLLACNVTLAGRSVGSNTIIADGAAIAFKKSVGAGCIIGDGAVVTKDIPDNVIAYGNPAKIIRPNDWTS